MRVLVCGGRDYGLVYKEISFIYNELHSLELVPGEDEFISGMAKGVDTVAANFAKTYGFTLHEFPIPKADWKTFGKRAGHMRNTRMLEEGRPDLVVAFPGGNGTAHMMGIAAKAGVEVLAIEDHT